MTLQYSAMKVLAKQQLSLLVCSAVDSAPAVCWDADTEEPLPEEGDCPAGEGPGGEEEEVGLLYTMTLYLKEVRH